MTESSKTYTRRRRFIKSSTVIGIGGLAGCTGETEPEEDDGDADPDPGDDAEADDDWLQDGDEIRFLVPFGPGGGFDTYTRLVTPYLEEELPADVDVVVDNIEGAGGQIGARELFEAEPDGHTIGISHPANFARRQVMEPEEVPFDLQEYTWFAQVAVSYHCLGTRDDVAADWDEFADEMAAGNISMGTGGPASSSAFVPAITGAISELWDPQFVMDNWVHFDGTPEAVQAMLIGDTDGYSSSDGNWLPLIDEDINIHAYMMTSDEQEFYDVPDELDHIPTLDELGVPGADDISNIYPARRVFGGPPGLPDEITETYREAFTAAIQTDQFQEEAMDEGRVVTYGDHEAVESAIATLLEVGEEHEDIIGEMFG